MTKLIVGGHSAGGTTALYVAHQDKRVKACVPNDPFVLVAGRDENIEEAFNLGNINLFVQET